MNKSVSNQLPAVKVDYMPKEFGDWLKDIQANFKGPLFLVKQKRHFIARTKTEEGTRIIGTFNIETQQKISFERRRKTNQYLNEYRRNDDIVPDVVTIPNEYLNQAGG